MSESIGVTRTADVLLRALGGRSVMLRMPAPAAAADVSEQLGMASPMFQDLPLAPVVFRKARASVTAEKAAKWELVISATAVAALVGSMAYASASVLFAQACGVLCDAELLEIMSATEQQAFGKPYVYRLLLRAPIAQIT